ncbi:MAG: hypothetical protein H6724_18930 [Sandaracinus sp.]|nr:hypothetical protein [Sandaracinus sp.]
MPLHRVFLAPGFFGFTNLGDFGYWAHVRDRLMETFARRRVRAEIHYVPTLPTSSLDRRAARLLETVARHVQGDDEVHLVGHSTGGLDARLLASPSARIPTPLEVAPIRDRIRTVISVATPHHGAPVAAFFTGLQGQKLLRAISMVTIAGIRLGSVPLPALLELVGAIPALPGRGLFAPRAGTLLDQVYRLVLKDFDPERQRQIEAYFQGAFDDQTLLLQLTPEAMQLFEALTPRHPNVRYGSVVVRAPAPSFAQVVRTGLRPIQQAQYALYRSLHVLSAGFRDTHLPVLDPEQREALVTAFGEIPGPHDSDGMVPTRSQVWGDVLHGVVGDHLDVIGHFHAPELSPKHVDWLRTGSGFDRERFETLWDHVAHYVVDA